ncbi:MAG: hypothetical protein ACU88J_14910 [Gammaproteobacteria bacterium]
MLNYAIESMIFEKPAIKWRNPLPGTAWRAPEVLQEGRMRCKMSKFTLLGGRLLVSDHRLEEMSNKIGPVLPLEYSVPAKMPAKLALSVYFWSTLRLLPVS